MPLPETPQKPFVGRAVSGLRYGARTFTLMLPQTGVQVTRNVNGLALLPAGQPNAHGLGSE